MGYCALWHQCPSLCCVVFTGNGAGLVFSSHGSLDWVLRALASMPHHSGVWCWLGMLKSRNESFITRAFPTGAGYYLVQALHKYDCPKVPRLSRKPQNCPKVPAFSGKHRDCPESPQIVQKAPELSKSPRFVQKSPICPKVPKST